MTVSEQNTLEEILRKNNRGQTMFVSEILPCVKMWLQQKLDAMPNGEWGEKTMLIELLEELGK